MIFSLKKLTRSMIMVMTITHQLSPSEEEKADKVNEITRKMMHNFVMTLCTFFSSLGNRKKYDVAAKGEQVPMNVYKSMSVSAVYYVCVRGNKEIVYLKVTAINIGDINAGYNDKKCVECHMYAFLLSTYSIHSIIMYM